MDRGAWQASVHGVARVGHNLVTKPPILGLFIDPSVYIYIERQDAFVSSPNVMLSGSEAVMRVQPPRTGLVSSK